MDFNTFAYILDLFFSILDEDFHLFNTDCISRPVGFLSGEAKRAPRHLGGSVWLPITHFHNTGHILRYSKFSSLSLDLSFLCFLWFLPFHCSFISISYPRYPPLIRHVATLGQGGSCPRPYGCFAPPQRPTCNFFYTLIFHHQCH